MQKKELIFAIFLIGFTAMSAQIVLLRQLIVVFYGNELSLGLILGAWLFLGAVGSWLLGKFADKIKNRQLTFAILQITLAFILVGTILVLRNAKAILGILPGEMIGFGPMAVFSFLLLCLICVILGFLFALACRIYPANNSIKPAAEAGCAEPRAAVKIGKVYILEGLGAVCGGCLVSFFFIRYFDSLYIMLGLAGLNIISAYLVQCTILRTRFILFSRCVNLTLIFILLALFFTQRAKEFKQTSIKQQWPHYRLLTVQDSVYSNLAVTQQNGQYTFFSNGLYLFSVPDVASAEEAVHFALLQRRNPQRILLIGGGIAGLAQEVLKHPVSKLHYVELDPKIIELGELFLPPEKTAFLKDSRLTVFHQDGRLFIKQLPLLSGFSCYDSIITYVGEPYTAQINRFYTQEFFQEVKKCLAPEGIFCFGLTSSENFLNKEQQRFLASIHKTLSSVFCQIKLIPGETAYFLAANAEGVLTSDYQELLQRLRERRIQTRFVREDYLFAKLAKDRISYLEEKLSVEKAPRINKDLRPISYYYNMLLWGSYFSLPGQRFFSWINEKRLWCFLFLVYLSILIFGLLQRKRKGAKSALVLLAVSTTGFGELSFQVAILLAFQIIYGYLYYKLGVILSFFMVGLVLGSWLSIKRVRQLKDDYGLFIKTQIAIFVYPIILPLIFYALNVASASRTASWIGSNIFFPLLPIIAGFVGGFQFPLANKIVLQTTNMIGRVAGLTYGMDLLGSCLGALLVSAFLVPILGIPQTCIAVAALNCAVLVSLIINRSK